MAFYADDTAIMTTSNRSNAIANRLQKAMVKIDEYFKKWRIQVNAAKTKAILFCFNNSKKRRPTRPLLFNNEELFWQDEVTYLGLVLDKKLTFGAHVENTRIKATKALNSLYPILGRKSKLSTANKSTIFKMYIRPILTYACPLWQGAARMHLNKFQVIQNKALKLIYNLNWRFRTTAIYRNTNFKTIYNIVSEMSAKFRESCSISTNDKIRMITDRTN